MRFTYAEAMTQAKFTPRSLRRPRRRASTRSPCPTIADLSTGVRLELSVHRQRRPGVPRRQAVHRDVDPVRAPRRGDLDASVHALRAEASDAAAGARREAGLLARGPDRQPLRARRWALPVAGGLRDARPPVGAARQAHGRDASTSCAGSRRASSSRTRASSTRSPSSSRCPVPTEPIPLLFGGHCDAGAAPRRRRATAGCTPAAMVTSSIGCSSRLAELRAAEGGHARQCRSRCT